MTIQTLRIAAAQLNLLVGDIAANSAKVLEACIRARDEYGCHLILFSELTLTGYPPEDLLLRKDFLGQVDQHLADLKSSIHGIDVVIGFPERQGSQLFNSAMLIREGDAHCIYRKKRLPNYGVFDEKRYFDSCDENVIFDLHGVKFGLTICEDIWQEGVVEQAVAAGARVILNLNASPYHLNKAAQRLAIVRQRVAATGVPFFYVNQIGGQDDLVFDGGSFVMNGQGEVVNQAPVFEESLLVTRLNVSEAGHVQVPTAHIIPAADPVGDVYHALRLGIRDYVRKNGFKGALVGLSGGIDSAVTLALAVDALGAENVEAVLLPSRYTADMSNEDAIEEACQLGVTYHQIPIAPAVNAFTDMLAETFAGSGADVTEENIQARSRGVVLMAISNKKRLLLLTTGNKSEMSVGYATLYGDMAGGFAPLKDVSKLWVYQLARYRNRQSIVIPQRVIDRPPSAELAPDQKDSDSLPPYEVLDPILESYIEKNLGIEEIVKMGFSRDDVIRIVGMVNRNEYKRRQAPPGVKITELALARERRFPMTSGFRP